MGCGRRYRGEWGGHKFKEKFGNWSGPSGPRYNTGNRAFDEYRDQALQRLEEEAQEFRSFLERLRAAKDRQEFDDYMRQRRERPTGPNAGGETPAPQT